MFVPGSLLMHVRLGRRTKQRALATSFAVLAAISVNETNSCNFRGDAESILSSDRDYLGEENVAQLLPLVRNASSYGFADVSA